MNNRTALTASLTGLIGLAGCGNHFHGRAPSLYETNADQNISQLHFGDDVIDSFSAVTKIDGTEYNWIYAKGNPVKVKGKSIDEDKMFPWVAVPRNTLIQDFDPETQRTVFSGDYIVLMQEPRPKLLTTGLQTHRRNLPEGFYAGPVDEDEFAVPMLNYGAPGYDIIGFGTDQKTGDLMIVDDPIVRIDNSMGNRSGGIIQQWSKTGKVYRGFKGDVDFGPGFTVNDISTKVKVEDMKK